jgi:hypothetical protein
LACVLYEALTGEPPFPGTTTAHLIAAHLNTPPPQPSTTQPDVPPQVDEVIATGMAKDPDRRYATTIELADAARDAMTVHIARPASVPAPIPHREQVSRVAARALPDPAPAPAALAELTVPSPGPQLLGDVASPMPPPASTRPADPANAATQLDGVGSPPRGMARTLARRESPFFWVPAAAGWTVGVIATLLLVASVLGPVRRLIKVPREFINDHLFNFPDTSLAWAFVLALLAAALAARKRIAWLLLLGYMILAAVVNVADMAAGGNTAAETFGENLGLGLHVVAIVLLALSYREFWAKVREGALFKSSAVLVTGGMIGVLASWGLLELFPGTLEPDDRFLYAVNRVIGFAVADPDLFIGRPHSLLNTVMGLLGALVLMAAAAVWFRSQHAANALTTHNESAIRGLLDTYGQYDPVSYFAERRDNAVVFAESGRAAITYRVEIGVCVADGDPIGDPHAWSQAIQAWLLSCQAYGWTPVVTGASAAGAETYRKAGFIGLQLGNETIAYFARSKLSRPRKWKVCQAVKRARHGGRSEP